ncbi:2,5-diketo-D-gluconate reductase A [Mycoplasmoides fastidiosum]|uniref:2,5-diketo-D-gluconate reductase A n=1 Tax=Mycoplasmoides fastidiosum TaxID=92758 RepID=A0ABU0M060_9BACT|nr:aldo/keto reductase [Mycoplasmoides fastidiosum]MDQ0514336.1 2,5-diketo-D-gluconate reductase A [Mycoplasmoides fastidiosum]UUD38061.1 aldo/keto reductase [Mycoplasmoides fastidiosum]
MKKRSKPRLGYGTYLTNTVNLLDWSGIMFHIWKGKYDFIDTAKYYENETAVGIVLAQTKQIVGDDFKIDVQTKINPEHYRDVRAAVLDSKRKLLRPKIESVLLHWPSGNFALDLAAWTELIQLQKEGIIDSIGVSNYSPHMLRFFEPVTGVKPAINQVQYSVHNRDYDYQAVLDMGIQVQAWRPLTENIRKLQADSLVEEIALNHLTNQPAVAIGFVKALGMDVVVKSANPDRVKANADAFHDLKLSPEEIKLLQTKAKHQENDVFWVDFTEPFNDATIAKLKAEVHKILTTPKIPPIPKKPRPKKGW